MQEYPQCWKTHQLCSDTLLKSVSYSQIAGIIVGMLGLSFFADRIGRRVGSITTASIMLTGGILLTASDGPTSHGVFLMYVISQVSGSVVWKSHSLEVVLVSLSLLVSMHHACYTLP